MDFIISILITIMVISFTVKSTIDWVWRRTFLKSFDNKINFINLKIWTSVALSILIAFRADIDVIAMLLKREVMTNIGMFLTGLLIAGGSNIINDVLKKINKTKEKFQVK